MPRKEQFEVAISEDSIKITDIHGEIVMWKDWQWETDGKITPIIAHAIQTCHTQGPAYLRSIRGKSSGSVSDYRQVGDRVRILSDQKASYWIAFQSDPACQVPSGSIGVVRKLWVGGFQVRFPSDRTQSKWQDAYIEFDWGDEGDLFVFENGTSGYGDAPNPPET